MADENTPGSVVEQLRGAGHDVLYVKESLRGAADDEILTRAQSEARVIITQDKDFGELAFRKGLPAECGVILFRLTGEDPVEDRRRMVEVVLEHSGWPGFFAVAARKTQSIRSDRNCESETAVPGLHLA